MIATKKTMLFAMLNLTIYFTLYSQQIDLVKLIPKCKSSVVRITTFDKENNAISTGTGFFIDSLGTIASCYHIFKGAFKANVVTSDGSTFDVSKVNSWNPKNDLILLSVYNPKKIVFKYLNRSKAEVQDGENVFTIGNPFGLEYSTSSGVVSATRSHQDYGKIIQFTAPISQGNSGSPLLNYNGEYLGIISFGYVGGQNLNFAVDANELTKLEKINALRFPEDMTSKLNSFKKNLLRANWGESIYKIKGKEIKSDFNEFATNMNNSVLYETMNNYTKCLVYDNIEIGDFIASVEYVFEKNYLSGINVKSEDLVKLKSDKYYGGFKYERLQSSQHIENFIKIINVLHDLYGKPINLGKMNCPNCYQGDISEILTYDELLYNHFIKNNRMIYFGWKDNEDNVSIKIYINFFVDENDNGLKENKVMWEVSLKPLN